MKKYMILVFVAVVALVIGGISLKNTQSESVVYAYANQDNNDKVTVPAKKIEKKDAVYGPVMLPEVNVIMKKKVTKVI